MLKTPSLSAAVAAVAAFIALAGAPPVQAMSGTSSEKSDFGMATKAVNGQNWREAIELLNKVVEKNAGNADAHNFLGYSYRKSGNHGSALKHYRLALKIDPRHKGAHEYIGEALLEVGDLPMAQRHLKALDDICAFGCEEYRQLKKAVAAYKKNHNISG
jgi:tetratricopeptide (TPR) repeat protein